MEEIKCDKNWNNQMQCKVIQEYFSMSVVMEREKMSLGTASSGSGECVQHTNLCYEKF